MAKTPARNVEETPAAPPDSKTPIHSAIDTIFKNDDSVRKAITANLRERTSASQAIATRAKAAFEDFTASRYSKEERARPTYLSPGDKLADSLEKVIGGGVEAVQKSKAPRSIQVQLDGEFRRLIHGAVDEHDDSLLGKVDLSDILEHLNRNSGVVPSFSNGGGLTTLQAEQEAERKLKEIEGTAPRAAAQAIVADGNGVPASQTPEELVKQKVALQMGTVTAPEAGLAYNVDKRSDAASRNESIQTFELRDGPSDVTSYHDFNNLEIAFEHVWTEIFDNQISTLGQELFHEYVKLKQFAGVDGEDPKVSTLGDLSRLMEEIKTLSRNFQGDTPADLRPPDGVTESPAPSGDNTVDIVKAVIDPAGALIGAIIDALTNGGKKPRLSWDSFPGPLPNHNDVIEVTFHENTAAEGQVEFELATDPGSRWKGIDFHEYDLTGTPNGTTRIANGPGDRQLLSVALSRLKMAILEFGSEEGWPSIIRQGRYLLGGLEQKLKSRTRVTFHWRD